MKPAVYLPVRLACSSIAEFDSVFLSPVATTVLAYEPVMALLQPIDALEIARITARDDDPPTPEWVGVSDDLICLVTYRGELV